MLPVPTILYHTSAAILRPLQLVAGPSIVAVAVLPVAEPPQLNKVALIQLSFTGAVGTDTVNVDWQVVVIGAQLLVYVNVTVVEPPVAAGAPVLLFVNTPLHPPLPEAVANQLANAAFTAACVCPEVSVVFIGHVNTTVGGAATVKVAWQVVVNGAQVLV